MEQDLMSEMAEDAQAIPESQRLEEIAKLAQEQIKLEAGVAKAEEDLKIAKENLREVSERKLPEAMTAVHMKEFKLTDGTKITVKPYYTAKVDDENREEAHTWLIDNGHQDLIKHQINVPLGKGEDHIARVLTEWLKENGITYTDKEGVHWQTLIAFIKEQIENGRDLPLDLFRVFIGQKAKVVRPKEK